MKREELQELISNYLDDRLDDGDESRLTLELERSPEARAALNEYISQDAMLKQALEGKPIRSTFTEDIMQTIAHPAAEIRQDKYSKALTFYALAAAAVLIAVFIMNHQNWKMPGFAPKSPELAKSNNEEKKDKTDKKEARSANQTVKLYKAELLEKKSTPKLEELMKRLQSIKVKFDGKTEFTTPVFSVNEMLEKVLLPLGVEVQIGSSATNCIDGLDQAKFTEIQIARSISALEFLHVLEFHMPIKFYPDEEGRLFLHSNETGAAEQQISVVYNVQDAIDSLLGEDGVHEIESVGDLFIETLYAALPQLQDHGSCTWMGKSMMTIKATPSHHFQIVSVLEYFRDFRDSKEGISLGTNDESFQKPALDALRNTKLKQFTVIASQTRFADIAQMLSDSKLNIFVHPDLRDATAESSINAQDISALDALELLDKTMKEPMHRSYESEGLYLFPSECYCWHNHTIQIYDVEKLLEAQDIDVLELVDLLMQQIDCDEDNVRPLGRQIFINASKTNHMIIRNILSQMLELQEPVKD